LQVTTNRLPNCSVLTSVVTYARRSARPDRARRI
jgi:hypothetical protein